MSDVGLQSGHEEQDGVGGEQSAETGGSSMLGAIAGRTGPGALQRRIQQRALQRKADGASAAAAVAGADAPADGSYGGVIRSVTKDDVELVSDKAKPAESLVVKLKKDELVQPTDLGGDRTWWKVKVVRGANVGKEGYAKIADLGSILNVKKDGTTDYSANVAGGKVAVKTGQEVDALGNKFGDNMFSLSYEGEDAGDAKWLQFIWREVIGVDDKDASAPVKGSITTTGGTYALTEGGTKDAPGTPAKANYNTDTKDPKSPFYEAGFAGDRTADSTTIYDQPYGATDKAKAAFKNGAKNVVSRAHFTTFLVKGRKVAFSTQIGIQWKFTKVEDTNAPPKGVHTVSNSGATDKLPATIRERFHEQYPDCTDIK